MAIAHNSEQFSIDNRSDDKGAEPEALALGSIDGRTHAFVGPERMGGIVVYDITDPAAGRFVAFANNANPKGDAEKGTAGDVAPEGIVFIPAALSPTGTDVIAVASEVSGTTTICSITQ